MIKETNQRAIATTLSFNKENGIWYANIPEFLEQGLGTKANLMMVDGADTFLDFLSNVGYHISLKICTEPFEGHEAVLLKESIGLNAALLDLVGHAPVSYGAYYNVAAFQGKPNQHRLWLCPVTEYVFGGSYPASIYINSIT